MIRFDDVAKTYAPLLGERVRAVEGMTFTVEAGEVFGIAGPNGAGKSTMIAMVLGFLLPTAGRVAVDGLPPRLFVERHGIGYLSELIAINPRWRTRESLVRFAILAGVPGALLAARVDEVMAMLALEEHAGKRTKELSKGTLQRLGLAQALLRDERVLVFDEPTHGLDPLWTQRFRELVPRLRRPDRAIVIASHNLDELERLADRVAIVDRGRLQRLVGTRGDANVGSVTRYRIVAPSAESIIGEIFPGATAAAAGEFDVPVADLAMLNAGLGALIARGALIVSVTPAYSRLEEQFRQAVGEGA
jgi:ABC-type multidrug transport system ATPase subunit